MGTSSESEINATAPVLLDTNILIYSASEPFDIAHQLENLGFHNLLVTEGVKSELDRLVKTGSKKEKRFARVALDIASRFRVLPDPPIIGGVDDQLLYLAKNSGYIVATSDIFLRRRLKKEGLSVIYLKKRRLIAECNLITKISHPTARTTQKQTSNKRDSKAKSD
ncbi:MAG: PIN domain-containing protein [Candidatus Methanomethylicaceae archaeon]